MRIESWIDASGILWELVELGDGDCLIRQGLDRCSWADGDVREGVEVVARFNDPETARAFLWDEGFEPVGILDA